MTRPAVYVWVSVRAPLCVWTSVTQIDTQMTKAIQESRHFSPSILLLLWIFLSFHLLFAHHHHHRLVGMQLGLCSGWRWHVRRQSFAMVLSYRGTRFTICLHSVEGKHTRHSSATVNSNRNFYATTATTTTTPQNTLRSPVDWARCRLELNLTVIRVYHVRQLVFSHRQGQFRMCQSLLNKQQRPTDW